MKNQQLIQKSIPKNEKLSTGVTTLSLSSEKVVTPYKEEIKQDKELKKEKRKKGFPALKAGKGTAPETTRINPNLSSGVAKEEKSENAGADLKSLVNAWQKYGYPLQPKLDNKRSTILWKG